MTPERANLLERIMYALLKIDAHGDLFWNDLGNGLQFFILCNDEFWWGTADLEEVTGDNIAVLEKAVEDVLATGTSYSYVATTLFCARVRGIRPQGALYKNLDPKVWPLLDAAGPIRETRIGNPHPRPKDPDEEV